MLTLYLKCKTCGIEFVSSLNIDKKSFETVILKNNYHICPRKHKNQYNKENYYFKE
jgi:hypothetical protein